MVIGHSGSLNCPKYPPAGQVAVKFLTVKYDFKTFARPLLYGHRKEKTCLFVLRPGKAQSGLLIYRD